jgi:hypothetical protein
MQQRAARLLQMATSGIQGLHCVQRHIGEVERRCSVSHGHWDLSMPSMDGRRGQGSPVPGNGRFGGLQKEKAEEDKVRAEKQ